MSEIIAIRLINVYLSFRTKHFTSACTQFCVKMVQLHTFLLTYITQREVFWSFLFLKRCFCSAPNGKRSLELFQNGPHPTKRSFGNTWGSFLACPFRHQTNGVSVSEWNWSTYANQKNYANSEYTHMYSLTFCIRVMLPQNATSGSPQSRPLQ